LGFQETLSLGEVQPSTTRNSKMARAKIIEQQSNSIDLILEQLIHFF